MEPVDLVLLIYGMREMLERTLGPRIALNFVLPATLCRALADAHQLELALLNLAVNASDAMPNGGTLRVEATQEAFKGSSVLREGHYVRLSLSDSGQGMDAATLARAMEPFFTTKGVGKGTGLGLAMVQGLAAQSGGRFELQSVVGQGTTATLWLPVTQAAAVLAVRIEARVGDPMRSPTSLRIVLVDDDPLVLVSTAEVLEDLGHEVLIASNAHQAQTLMAEANDVQLVIADQVMPQTTGSELFEILRRDYPRVRLILTSGYLEQVSAATGSFRRLAKPFDVHQLVEAIESAMAEGALPNVGL